MKPSKNGSWSQLSTDRTEQEHKDEANQNYHHIFNYMSVAVLLAFFGVSYYLLGRIATVRKACRSSRRHDAHQEGVDALGGTRTAPHSAHEEMEAMCAGVFQLFFNVEIEHYSVASTTVSDVSMVMVDQDQDQEEG
ncbi:hypothetical protein TARUN_1093 [Trichoderma arundinaceum]|uniref:Uncharacterized protein n=1 Tax=Trichoderma arundinaceum TaxID=490622 RepID=A0A395NYD9_TRIAR|nr:hypothetical protein TARUN_1093 [Trichoderma arundinaceum]